MGVAVASIACAAVTSITIAAVVRIASAAAVTIITIAAVVRIASDNFVSDNSYPSGYCEQRS